ncbi:UNVERIFIED_CONTAM: AP2 domain transcription factor AP2IX-6 [Hammondia hammondi]|eukprot:XP_008889178.1 AP2 domain transcription factor AP2IX-6 [Hammondia hammondi]
MDRAGLMFLRGVAGPPPLKCLGSRVEAFSGSISWLPLDSRGPAPFRTPFHTTSALSKSRQPPKECPESAAACTFSPLCLSPVRASPHRDLLGAHVSVPCKHLACVGAPKRRHGETSEGFFSRAALAAEALPPWPSDFLQSEEIAVDSPQKPTRFSRPSDSRVSPAPDAWEAAAVFRRLHALDSGLRGDASGASAASATCGCLAVGSRRNPCLPASQLAWNLSQMRMFGGRAGGLKRRKPRRDPGRVIQSGLGRRQEFFWPEKARRTRVPLYQNSRPNLVYDQRFRRFMCMWYASGVQVFRPFSCRGRRGGRGKEGLPDGLGIGRGSGTWERARAKAVVLLKQLQRQGHLDRLAKPDVTRSGVRGVYFDTEEKLWVATWNEHGLRRFKAFPTMEMGFDAAYQAAVAVRRQKLRENYIFCMQRNRKKSGRPPFK